MPPSSPLTVLEAPSSGPADQLAGSIGDSYGNRTAVTAGTPILSPTNYRSGSFKTRSKRVIYTAGGTAHVLTAMVPFATVHVAQNAAAGQPDFYITSTPNVPQPGDGGDIAANDYLVTVNAFGGIEVFRIGTMTIATAKVTVSLSTGTADGSGLTQIIEKGAPVWFYGAPANHASRQFPLRASTRETLEDLAFAPQKSQPILIHIDNVTAAGDLVQHAWEHVAV